MNDGSRSAVAGAPRGPAAPNLVLAVLTIMSVLAALQGSVVIPLVANVPALFDVTAAEASWVVTANLLGGAISAPIVSRLADMFGKRRVIVLTLIMVAVGALVVALSHNFLLSVAGRVLQGGAAGLIPVAMSVAKDVLPAHRVGFGVAVLSGTMSLGAALGLPLAGVLYALWGWPGLFWVSVVLAPLLALALWIILPATDPQGGRFDFVGAFLLAGLVASVLLLITQGFDWGWSSPWILAAVIAAVLSSAVWIPWSLRHRHPMVDLRIATSKPVAMTNVASFLLSAGMLASLFLASQQLGAPVAVGGMGFSSGMVGALLAVPASVMLVLTPVTGILLNRWGGRPVMIGGAIIMALSYLARIGLDDSVVAILGGTVMVSVGTAFALSAQPMLIMAAVPAGQAASANGVNSLFRTFGTATSISVIAALTSLTATQVGGIQVPGTQTFHAAFILFAILTGIAAVLSCAIPRGLGDK